MRLHTTKEHDTNIAGESADFSITMNSKAFNILLDGLYTHKIRAVVRELWTNAFDSHIEAGIEAVPFDVHLPTRLAPTFKVRDYGVSMDHQTVMELYTTVFGSTKDTADVAVGAFGLGSKSPFAYTGSFTVIARLDGRKRTYLASMGANGVPSITLMSDVESDEAQGIEVTLPVNPLDINEFHEEARNVALGFDPRPNIDGAEISTPDPTYVADDRSWAIYRSDDMPGRQGVYVRQGCVIYPVDDNQVSNILGQVVQRYYGAVVLNVPIGTVSITPSRESIQLDAETKANLFDAAKAAAEGIQAMVDAETDALPNLRTAIEWAWSGKGSYELLAVRPKFRGKEIPRHFSLEGGSDWEVPLARQGNRKKPVRLRALNFQQVANAKFVIRHADNKVKREMIRYRDYVKQHGRHGVWLLTDPTKKQIERLMHLTGVRREQFVWVGHLPDPGPQKRDRKKADPNEPKVKRGIYRWNNSHWNPYDYLDEFPAEPFYVTVVDRITKEMAQAWRRSQVVRQATAVGFKVDRPVVIMTETAFKRYNDHGMPKVEDAAEAFLNDSADKVEQNLIGYFVQDTLDHNAELFLGEFGINEAHLVNRYSGFDPEAAAETLGRDRFGELRDGVREAARWIRKRYPLLWADGSDLAEHYVRMVNAGN